MANSMTNSPIMSPKERINYYKTTMQPLIGTGNERLQRHWKFYKEICPSKLDYIASAAFHIGAGLGGGAVFGGFAAIGVNRVLTGDKDSIPSDRAFYTGFGIGALIGGYLTYKCFLTHVEKTKCFQAWHEKNKEELINFTTFLQYTNDSLLKGNICEITQNILVGPCRTPTGYLVEFYMLTQLPKDSDGKISCPFTREKFFDTEARKDYERALVINKRALHLIEEDLVAAKENPAIVKLLENQKKFIKESIEECYQNCLIDIEKRRMLNLITFEDSQKERNNFVELFGSKSDHPVDWKFDWMHLLSIRWKARFPGEKFFEI